MAFIACDGSITQDGSGVPACSGTWMVVPDQAIYRELDPADADEIWDWALLVLVIAFGIKVIRQTFFK